jgi:hypothetical protein
MTEPARGSDDAPAAVSHGAPTAAPGVVPSVAAGCAGFIVFYISGFALAIATARGGTIGAVFVGALILVVAATAVRSAPASSRPILARVAAGVAVAALVFGGCLALLAGGKIRIGG